MEPVSLPPDSDRSGQARLATLPMYDFPELRDAHDALWRAIAERLESAELTSVPQALTRSEDLLALWRDPRLLLGQTCGYPLMTELADQVQLVATPAYRAAGCDGAFHRSAIIVRAEDEAVDLPQLRGRRCAINGWDSNTGMNLLRASIAPLAGGARFFNSVAVSGSHRQSLHLVAAGAADVAAIDGVSLALLSRIDPTLAAATRVLAWSPLSPGLPLVTASATDARSVEALRQALADVAADPALSAVRAGLLLDGFEILPMEAYASIVAFERNAAASGYPRLA